MLRNIKTLLWLSCLLATNHLWAQCPPGASTFRLDIQPDMYFTEISWSLTGNNGTVSYGQGNCTSSDFLSVEYCIPEGASCTTFTISDSYGDGIAPGYYRLYLDDVLIFENATGVYTTIQQFQFNCPPGTSCSSGFPITEGSHTTLASGIQTWYAFTPAENGSYLISTCNGGNACGTKIWVYDHCDGLVLTDNNLETIFYSEDGCGGNGQSEANLYLQGGKTYYLRIGYKNSSTCNETPINFDLSYVGPIVGCTDPLSCNFNALATISDTSCIYPGDPGCDNLPDLIILEDELRNTISLGFQNNADGCAVDEGCYKGYGQRSIIEFSTHIKNIGEQDYYIGEPPASPSIPSNQFTWDACHNHWHYTGYAEYILFDAQGNQVPIGSKNGFCVLDLECQDGGNGKYSCGNMGISTDCGDIYSKGLPCQWIDITDLAAGTYTFVVRVNWDQTPDKNGRIEKTYDNNWAQACFQLSYPLGNSAPFVDFINDCPVYTDCEGVVFGNAQLDCEGTCKGTALKGDWDKDAARTAADVTAYVTAALTDTSSVTTCRDLFADDHLSLYDAALLQECNLHHDDVQYWGARFPCQFPTGIQNPKELVYFLPGNLDTTAHTFDVEIVNPYNRLLGYEIDIKGLKINQVENLSDGFDASYYTQGNRIIALSTTEQPMKKNILPTAVLRIHYDSLTASTVCIDSVIAVVNHKYQLATAELAAPNCVTIQTSGTKPAQATDFRVVAMPNPAFDDITLFFENTQNAPVTVKLTDVHGRTVRVFNGVRTDNIVLERGNLPAGLYQFTLQTEQGAAAGRIIWQ